MFRPVKPTQSHFHVFLAEFNFLEQSGQQTIGPKTAAEGELNQPRTLEKGWRGGPKIGTTAVSRSARLQWPAALAWTVCHRRWKVLAGAAVAAAAALVVASAWDPRLLPQYLDTLLYRPRTSLVDYPTPTVGMLLAIAFSAENTWVRYLPTLAGLSWLAVYFFGRCCRWDWGSEAPVLIFVSILTAFYTWPCDMVLFVIPLMRATALVAVWPRSRSRVVLGCYLAVNLLALAFAFAEFHSFWFFWVGPTLAAGYVGVMFLDKRPARVVDPVVGIISPVCHLPVIGRAFPSHQRDF